MMHTKTRLELRSRNWNAVRPAVVRFIVASANMFWGMNGEPRAAAPAAQRMPAWVNDDTKLPYCIAGRFNQALVASHRGLLHHFRSSSKISRPVTKTMNAPSAIAHPRITQAVQ